MPLSEEERKRLEELERDLAAEDPILAQELQSGSVRPRSSARTFLGFLAAIAGMLLIIVGIVTQIIVVGVLGFLLMGVGAHALLDQRGFGKRLK